MKSRGGRGSENANVKLRNVDLGSINEIGQAVSGSQARHEAAKQKSYVTLDPEDIIRVSNPREVYCSLQEFKAVDWPSLDTKIEDLENKMERALACEPWYEALSTVEKERAKAFFMGIHELSCSMVDNGQIQAIVLERQDPQARTAKLLAGERRTLAALYSRGAITSLNAEVWNVPLDDLKRARIKDQENAKEGLTPIETIVSKWGIYQNLPNASTMSLSELARELSYKTISTPSQLRRIYESPVKDDLLSVIRSENAGWRRIGELIHLSEGDPDAILDLKRQYAKLPRKKPDNETRRSSGKTHRDYEKAAARHGLVIKPRTDTSLAKLLLSSALESELVPVELRDEIKKYDLSTVESIGKCWAALGEAMMKQGKHDG